MSSRLIRQKFRCLTNRAIINYATQCHLRHQKLFTKPGTNRILMSAVNIKAQLAADEQVCLLTPRQSSTVTLPVKLTQLHIENHH